MTTIKDIHLPFRDELLPASFRGAPFFCEANSRDNGRRIIVHEFPKKDLPYAEDMGRKAKSFSIRAFCITYPLTLEETRGSSITSTIEYPAMPCSRPSRRMVLGCSFYLRSRRSGLSLAAIG
jgi:hypothetical protein